MKNYWVAFFCLLFGGFFGLHHFYLGRFKHGMIYLFTCGGFSFGVLHDLVRLNSYVHWANFDKDCKEVHLSKTRENPVPTVSFARGFGLFVLPQVLGNLVRLAIPRELLHPAVFFLLLGILVPLAIGFAVWYVGTVGECQGSLKDALKGAYWTSPLYIFDLTGSNDMLASLVSAHFFRSSWTFRLKPAESPGFVRGILYVLLTCLVMSALFASMVAFNCEIENEGEQVKCRDALRHFFTSPLWQDILSSLREMKASIREGGWERFVQTVVLLMDPTGELHAYNILGVSKDTSDEDIRKAYRQLSREFHPDKNKFKEPEEAKQAENRFMEVQAAFETLQLRRSRTTNEPQQAETEQAS